MTPTVCRGPNHRVLCDERALLIASAFSRHRRGPRPQRRECVGHPAGAALWLAEKLEGALDFGWYNGLPLRSRSPIATAFSRGQTAARKPRGYQPRLRMACGVVGANVILQVDEKSLRSSRYEAASCTSTHLPESLPAATACFRSAPRKFSAQCTCS